MIAATLFSGIGAPECAMPHWRWAWGAEIEPFASAVLAARHPHSINLGDVTADDFAERAAAIAIPDVLVFGSPCQDWSVAGKRLGLAGARGNLALVALGIIGRLRPRWFVFENVPGLLSNWSGAENGPHEAGAEWETDESGDFAAFLGCVDELGYSGAWASLDAQFFGLAQRRERLFFVGHIGDWRGPSAVLAEPESLCGDSPPRRGEGQAVASGLGSGSPRSGGRIGRREAAGNQLIPFDTTQITSKTNRCQPGAGDPCHPLASSAHPPAVAFGGGNTSGPIDVATCRTAHTSGSCRIDFESETFVVTHSLRAAGFDASEDGTGRGTPIVCINAQNSAVAVALRGRDGGATAELSDVPSALRASQGGGDKPYVMTSAVRRLTPRECERLMGFADDFTAITYRGKPAADGPRYRALGNSMAVPVVRWILSRIEQAEGRRS